MSTEVSQDVSPPQEAIPIPQSHTPCKLTGWDHIAFSVPVLVAAARSGTRRKARFGGMRQGHSARRF